MRGEMKAFQESMRGEMKEFKDSVRAEIDALRREIRESREALREEWRRDIEVALARQTIRLLLAFGAMLGVGLGLLFAALQLVD